MGEKLSKNDPSVEDEDLGMFPIAEFKRGDAGKW